MKIDIRTEIVPSTTSVWRLFPGSNYRFLGTYFQTNTAFLDIPGMEISANTDLTSGEAFARMVASQRTKQNIAQHKDDASVEDWRPYLNSRRTKTRGRQFQAINNFYTNAKAGDYLVVPSTLSQALVWVGRFSDATIVTTSHDRYGDIAVPARRVKWLAEVKENKLSRPLSQSLRNQHPFSLVEKSRYLEVFSAASSAFKFGDRHVSLIANTLDDFLDVDSALLGVVSKLAANACYAMASGVDGIGVGTLAAILSNPPIEYTSTQESDIHSEGFTRLISAALTPIVISTTLIFLSGLPVGVTEDQYNDAVAAMEVVNTSEANDVSCAPPVAEATRRILSTIDFDTARQMCESIKEAERRAGLKPSSSLIAP